MKYFLTVLFFAILSTNVSKACDKSTQAKITLMENDIEQMKQNIFLIKEYTKGISKSQSSHGKILLENFTTLNLMESTLVGVR